MTLKIAHRGAAAHEDENTLSSFRKAIEFNADMIEFDVHLCSTGEIVVIHDETLERTTDGSGLVSKTPFEKIRSLKTHHGHSIPTLIETLETINRRARVNIELKRTGTPQAVSKIITLFMKDRGWKYQDFLISSFDKTMLEIFRNLHPKCPIAFLTDEPPNNFLSIKHLNLEAININFRNLTAESILKFHDQGLKVYVFTVNAPADIKRMKALGLDGIFSDWVERI